MDNLLQPLLGCFLSILDLFHFQMSYILIFLHKPQVPLIQCVLLTFREVFQGTLHVIWICRSLCQATTGILLQRNFNMLHTHGKDIPFQQIHDKALLDHKSLFRERRQKRWALYPTALELLYK